MPLYEDPSCSFLNITEYIHRPLKPSQNLWELSWLVWFDSKENPGVCSENQTQNRRGTRQTPKWMSQSQASKAITSSLTWNPPPHMYPLNFVISTSLVSLLLLYFKPWGTYVFSLSFTPLYHVTLPNIMGFDNKIQFQGNQITLLHTSYCHRHNHCYYRYYCKCYTSCYSKLSHATLMLFYRASMLTLHNSLISRALWLPQASYYGV